MRVNEYLKKYDVLVQEQPEFEHTDRHYRLLKEIGRGKRVLDLGCLGGQISRKIKDQNNDVYGVELNPKAAAQAEKQGIRVKVFDLNDGVPFQDGFFDTVHAGEIIEHIFDTQFLFEECNRVLKPGGTFLFTVPNLNSLTNRLRVVSGAFLPNYGAYADDHNGSRIRLFNLDKVAEVCRLSGFQVTQVYGLANEQSSSTAARLAKPLAWWKPALADLLFVRARRLDQ